MVRRALPLIVTVVLSVTVVTGVAWSALALWFDGPSSRVLVGTMCAAMGFISLLLAALVRPFSRGLLVAILPMVVVALWWA